jgi:hypothetical protein
VNETLPLQFSDLVDEGWLGPWFGRTARLPEGDQTRSGLFNHTVAIEFELTQQDRLARAGRSGQDESFQGRRTSCVWDPRQADC